MPLAAALPGPAPAIKFSSPAVAAAPHLDDPLLSGNQHWRGDNGDTYFELFTKMMTEAATHTFWPVTEHAVEAALCQVKEWSTTAHFVDLDTAHVKQDSAATDQALRLGYALAMTREHAPAGIDAWYIAALAYARIVPMTDAEYEAAYDRLNALNE